ncbi:NAD(P)-binding domain-containing protein [Dioscorea alata]|uniref:NAD(P)-binding domain-containing protein n=1 Tax=Dioscorea alata TaxID=55571 RepID=A0ACB7VK60_DIOAL|nr:NAD(P)-binding domain-containing protein [Dioscorea alata]
MTFLQEQVKQNDLSFVFRLQVNNAAVLGIFVDLQDLHSSTKESIEKGEASSFFKLLDAAVEDYEKTEECLNINYYGTKKVIDALKPFLQLSHSPEL